MKKWLMILLVLMLAVPTLALAGIENAELIQFGSSKADAIELDVSKYGKLLAVDM